MPFHSDRLQSLLLALFCWEAATALSSVPTPTPDGVRHTLGGGNVIRPELSRDSYAHQSAIENNYGVSVDIKVSSEEKGLGAFATSPIPFGTLLGRYAGEALDEQEVRARFWNKADKTQADIDWEESRKRRNQGITGHFLFELPNGSFVCAEDADVSPWIRFLNHADRDTVHCNVGAFIKTGMDDEDEEFPLMYAISDISVGEELCWDYGGKFFT